MSKAKKLNPPIKVRGLKGWKFYRFESLLTTAEGKPAAEWFDIYNHGKIIARLDMNGLVYLGADDTKLSDSGRFIKDGVLNPVQAARYVFLVTQKPIKK